MMSAHDADEDIIGYAVLKEKGKNTQGNDSAGIYK